MARPRVDGNQDTDSFRVRIGEHARARFREVAAGRGLTEAEAVRQAMHLWASMPIGDTKSEGLFGAEGGGESAVDESQAATAVGAASPPHPQRQHINFPQTPGDGKGWPLGPPDHGDGQTHSEGEPTGVPDRLQSGPAEGSNPSSPAPVEEEVARADAPVDDDRAFVDPVPPPSPPEPDEKPPATRPKAPLPKAAKNVEEAAAQLAARAKQREPEHVHKPVARKGSVNPGCVSCSMIKIGQNWIQPETDPAAPTDEDEW